RESRERNRAETFPRGFERNESEQFQKRRGEYRHRVAFKNQRAREKDRGTNCPGVERQARCGGGMGSSQRDARADRGAKPGERSGARVDRAWIQANRCTQNGARLAGERERDQDGGGVGEEGAEENGGGKMNP